MFGDRKNGMLKIFISIKDWPWFSKIYSNRAFLRIKSTPRTSIKVAHFEPEWVAHFHRNTYFE